MHILTPPATGEARGLKSNPGVESGSGLDSSGTSRRSIRILLAEDNDGDVFLVRRALDSRGLAHELTVARTGDEAVRLLNQCDSLHQRDEQGHAKAWRHGENFETAKAPKLILLDLNLPRMDGAQVLTRIRAMQAFAKTPVIVLTSSDSPRDRQAVLALGADLYFRKPTDLDSFMQLGQVVEETLASRYRD
jgi:chemotaxis family two-component system response regulator Rcp1